MGLDRLDPGLGLLQAGHVGEAEQARCRGAVDVSVEQADLQPVAGQRDGEIGSHGGLADTALAGGDGNDALRRLGRRAALGMRGRLPLRLLT